MSSEHNPIATLISKIQDKWTREASPFPEFKVVRWLIKPDQARLFEGFLRLESTEHGSIPEVCVTMLTPFENKEEFTISLINDWCKNYTDDLKTRNKLSAGTSPLWSGDTFVCDEDETENNTGKLLAMLDSFQQTMIGNDITLVVALFPHSVREMGEFNIWIQQLLKQGIPDRIRFMIFDHIGANYFSYAVKNHPGNIKTLTCELDLDGAIAKIAKMGNPNSPEVKFRECMLEMGKAVQNKNKDKVHEWGKKGLLVTRKSGSKSMFSTAHIVYAGMLFNFKQYYEIDHLLNEGLTLAKQGLKTEEASCRPLIVQYYGFIGSSKQLQGRLREAIEAFELQGNNAVEFDLPALALTPFRQAYTLGRKYETHKYEELLQRAFDVGKSLTKDEKANSSFSNIALDYLQWLETKRNKDLVIDTENELAHMLGNTWKEIAGSKSKMSPLESPQSLTIS